MQPLVKRETREPPRAGVLHDRESSGLTLHTTEVPSKRVTNSSQDPSWERRGRQKQTHSRGRARVIDPPRPPREGPTATRPFPDRPYIPWKAGERAPGPRGRRGQRMFSRARGVRGRRARVTALPSPSVPLPLPAPPEDPLSSHYGFPHHPTECASLTARTKGRKGVTRSVTPLPHPRPGPYRSRRPEISRRGTRWPRVAFPSTWPRLCACAPDPAG